MEDFVDLVFDHQHGQAAARPNPVDGGEHVRGTGRVQVRGGLVEDQHGGFQREHGCKRHALLLAPGKFQHAPPPEARQTHKFQRLVNAAMDVLRLDEVILKRESDLLLHREGDDLILGILEQHVDASKALRRGQFAPVDQASLRIGDEHASLVPASHVVGIDADKVQRQRALARTAATEDEDERTRLDGEGDLVQGRRAFRVPASRFEPETVLFQRQGSLVR